VAVAGGSVNRRSVVVHALVDVAARSVGVILLAIRGVPYGKVAYIVFCFRFVFCFVCGKVDDWHN
jgi:hypothetical protein